ncbi:MAG: IS630 family transposase [Nitrospinaceae bacterium]|nr:IS630 family transposase [Nitrospinaceae bacterium]
MAQSIFPDTSEADIELMEAVLKKGHIKHKYAVRIQAVLNRAAKIATKDIAAQLHIDMVTVSRFVRRFNEGGIEALLNDKTRKAGKAPVPVEIKNEISRIVCQEKPKNASHWSTREIANRVGISHNAVAGVLRERNLKPHMVKRFQFSNDPEFEEKLADVVGLYLDPPENSIVFCIDEKTQIQALERSQPILPILPGVPERQTHDYYRHGTTTLFAALNVLNGRIIGSCKGSHKSVDYIAFLKLVHRKAPRGKTLHIIVDNQSAHKTKAVRDYIESRKGRFIIHYTPTHSSWLNLIERWFAEITNKRIRRGSWTGIRELERAILEYIHEWNESKRRFVWTKTADEIIEAVEKARG